MNPQRMAALNVLQATQSNVLTAYDEYMLRTQYPLPLSLFQKSRFPDTSTVNDEYLQPFFELYLAYLRTEPALPLPFSQYIYITDVPGTTDENAHANSQEPALKPSAQLPCVEPIHDLEVEHSTVGAAAVRADQRRHTDPQLATLSLQAPVRTAVQAGSMQSTHSRSSGTGSKRVTARPPSPTQRLEERGQRRPAQHSFRPDLLRQWSAAGDSNMSRVERTQLKQSMSFICAASSNDLGERMYNIPCIQQESQTAQVQPEQSGKELLVHCFLQTSSVGANRTWLQAAEPHHYVRCRTEHSNQTQGTGCKSMIVRSTEYKPQSMQLIHSYVNLQDFLYWLKGEKEKTQKLSQLPSSMQPYFGEKPETFLKAEGLAQQILPLANSSLTLLTGKLSHLKNEELVLLQKLVDYCIYKSLKGELSNVRCGYCSLQYLHSRIGKRLVTELTVLPQLWKAACVGYGCLNYIHKVALLRGMSTSEGQSRASKGRRTRKRKDDIFAEHLTAIQPPLYPAAVSESPIHRYSLQLPELHTLEEWRLKDLLQQLRRDVTLTTHQLKQELKLPMLSVLSEVTVGSSQFVDSIRRGQPIEAAKKGVWMVPTDTLYTKHLRPLEQSAQSTYKNMYLRHFFLSLDPDTELGRLNREAATKKLDRIHTLEDSELYVQSLFPNRKSLQKAFKNALQATVHLDLFQCDSAPAADFDESHDYHGQTWREGGDMHDTEQNASPLRSRRTTMSVTPTSVSKLAAPAARNQLQPMNVLECVLVIPIAALPPSILRKQV